MIRVIVNEDHAVAEGPFPISFIRVISTLAGRKVWLDKARVKFENFPANLDKLRDAGNEIEFEDRSGILADLRQLEELSTQHSQVLPQYSEYVPAMPLFEHQRKALDLSWNRTSFALLLEMGLGKSAILIATAGRLSLTGRVTGLLVFSPKGVHKQWAYEQLAAHADKNIYGKCGVWNGSKILEHQLGSGPLEVLCMNIDAARTTKGKAAAEFFLRNHYKKSIMAVDESHDIKTYSSSRTKAVIELGRLATYRRILTGTPLTNNIVDAYSQFNFLDERITGHIYITTFKAEYCIFSKDRPGEVVGSKNIEKFYLKISPHEKGSSQPAAEDLCSEGI
jgi:hypothetical protein